MVPFLLLLMASTPVAAEMPRPELDPAKLGTPFQRYTTKDALGRTVTFYLSVPPNERPQAKWPVVLFIQGSGCQSLFTKQRERVAGGYQNLIWAEAKYLPTLDEVKAPETWISRVEAMQAA